MDSIQTGSEFPLHQDGDGLISLNDIWRMARSPLNKDPRTWLRSESAIRLMDTIMDILNVRKTHIIKVQRGRGKVTGGTWAHKQIALAYAKYLDPKLHYAVNQTFFERVEEENNPELAIQRGQDRAIRTWKKQGKTDKWIETRLKGMLARKHFTSILKAHGVKNEGYKNCTNIMYVCLYGGTAEVVRYRKGIPDGTNVRENMPEVELIAVNLIEAISAEKIENNKLYGNAQCEMACRSVANNIAKALIHARRA
ncbi:hypothetical protein GCM10027299_22050 [Larkinella ripae]